MRELLDFAARIAQSDCTVLIEGETGTGKSLLARTIHRTSRRAGGPFVVVDCGAIPPSLVESELFGHERGAFTGAHAARPGAFELAHGGSVFLDEIGELPLDVQPRLLRVIEERVVKRVGAPDPVRIDVRLIAATNRDVRADVAAGRFRSDLFYRLNVVTLRTPPLRDRPEDIAALVAHFWRTLDPTGGAPPPALVAALARRAWPGNVRELRSAVERAYLFGDPDAGDHGPGAPAPAPAPVPLPAPVTPPRARPGDPPWPLNYREAKRHAVTDFEVRFIRDLLDRYRGNLSRAARAVDMDRNYLRALAKRYLVPIER